MNEKKDPNKIHYFKPVMPEDFAESLMWLAGLKIPQPVTIWEKGENEELAELYIVSSYDPEKKIIKMKPTGSLMTKITGSTKAQKIVLIKVAINEKTHFFSGGLLNFHPKDLSYSLEIQQDIFKSQQRGTFRLNASDVIPIQFKIDEQVFEALDISLGGTSFVVNQDDLPRFKKGHIFNDCTLRFDRKNYYIPKAQIAIVIPMTEGDQFSGKYKIGISFKDLSRKTEEELYIKISTEARGDEMKKKFDLILAKKSE
jgi:hypothetical protein